MILAVFLFWGVVYPFSYRRFKESGRVRYAHIISVILILVIPLPLALVHLKEGYIITATPPYGCFGADRHYNFYAITLPLSITLVITTCLLVLIFWTIFKVRNKEYTIANQLTLAITSKSSLLQYLLQIFLSSIPSLSFSPSFPLPLLAQLTYNVVFCLPACRNLC